MTDLLLLIGIISMLEIELYQLVPFSLYNMVMQKIARSAKNKQLMQEEKEKKKKKENIGCSKH